ncbi:metal-dependent hydrolase [Marininema halotolerans]|uniref:Inner membrane protein n=1 Tax=Marininema halotolerans TaxID=1155944 RepID=A0A1I6S549_9BACL|nr:metal-dependent hydrolase [Marininema halotolerans]SFS72099.1 inner membrane protein [Marininema halotolerans]
MTGNTHLSLGVAAGAFTVAAQGLATDVGACVTAVVVASIGSILPDIDEDGSTLNNLLFRSIKYRSIALAILGAAAVLLGILKGLALWVVLAGMYAMAVAFIPHRSFTHSLLSLLLVSGITYMAEPSYMWPLAAGYLSHLLADGITAGGIPLFWPWKKRMGTKNIGFSIRSGDIVDKVTGKVAMYGGSIILLYLLFSGASYDPLLEALRDPVGAFRYMFRS